MRKKKAEFRYYTALRQAVLPITIAASACLMMLLSAAVADELAELRELGFDFPSEISGFARGRIVDHEREHPGLGYSIAYHGPQTEEATAYVYDLGVRNIPDGPMNAAVRQVFEQAAREVLATEGHVGRARIEMLDPYVVKSPAGDAQYVCARFEFQMVDGSTLGSYLYVTSERSKFLKIRVTLPMSDAADMTARNFADAAASMLIAKERP